MRRRAARAGREHPQAQRSKFSNNFTSIPSVSRFTRPLTRFVRSGCPPPPPTRTRTRPAARRRTTTSPRARPRRRTPRPTPPPCTSPRACARRSFRECETRSARVRVAVHVRARARSLARRGAVAPWRAPLSRPRALRRRPPRAPLQSLVMEAARRGYARARARARGPARRAWRRGACTAGRAMYLSDRFLPRLSSSPTRAPRPRPGLSPRAVALSLFRPPISRCSHETSIETGHSIINSVCAPSFKALGCFGGLLVGEQSVSEFKSFFDAMKVSAVGLAHAVASVPAARQRRGLSWATSSPASLSPRPSAPRSTPCRT